jgi:hypothetical protein
MGLIVRLGNDFGGWMQNPCKLRPWEKISCYGPYENDIIWHQLKVLLLPGSLHPQTRHQHFSMFITWISPNGGNVMAIYQFNFSLTTSVISEEFVKPCDILVSDSGFVAQTVGMGNST